MLNYNNKRRVLLKLLYAFTLIALSFTATGQFLSEKIALNQEGFYPDAQKIAVVTTDVKTDVFYITSSNLRDTVYTGQLGLQKQSLFSATTTRIADFTSLKKVGSFVILIPGLGHSFPFVIDNSVHRRTAVASIKGFYFQRVSSALDEKYAGRWHRSVGHPDDVVYIHPSAASSPRPAGTIVSSPGGWYDAGDYNKYIVNSGITMGTLLAAYEDYPQYFKKLTVDIPESRDIVPDILNEAVYNLKWMLTMQDPYDGGVYHKCTNAAFDGMVMPGITKDPRFLVQKSTAAALDFAAVMSQASRVFGAFEDSFPGFADKCLKAAQKAWKWAQASPDLIYDQRAINQKYQPAITTGEYGDKVLSDEWLWAAAELFISTKQKHYFDTVQRHMKDPFDLPSWSRVGGLAYYSFIRFQSTLPVYTNETIAAMKDSVIRKAEGFIARRKTSAFDVIMGQSIKDFVWGSNAVAANQGILLLNAYKITKHNNYISGALSNLDYLLGRNATGFCFLTGSGSKSTMHPHHRQSEADGVTDPVPGLLAGGPNPGRQDKCSYEFTEPETSYSDNVGAYASNEIAINWNAPFVYLVSAIEAIMSK